MHNESNTKYAAAPFRTRGHDARLPEADWHKLKHVLANVLQERLFFLRVIRTEGHDVTCRRPQDAESRAKRLVTNAAGVVDTRARDLAMCLTEPIVSRHVAGRVVRNMAVWIGLFL